MQMNSRHRSGKIHLEAANLTPMSKLRKLYIQQPLNNDETIQNKVQSEDSKEEPYDPDRILKEDK